MKVIFTETGEKRYKFEDGDLIARRKFEEGLTSPDDMVRIIDLLIAKATQRIAETWTNARNAILEIVPEADLSGMSYDYFTGTFRNSIPK